jgi:hypothetical protein
MHPNGFGITMSWQSDCQYCVDRAAGELIWAVVLETNERRLMSAQEFGWLNDGNDQ